MASVRHTSFNDSSSDASSDIFDLESKENEDRVPLEHFATDDQFSRARELLQLPPGERSREHVECIFELVRDNKFFAELDAEMSLELCRHMTYTTMKADRVLFYKGDPGKPIVPLALVADDMKLASDHQESWQLEGCITLCGWNFVSAQPTIEELKAPTTGEGAEQASACKKAQGAVEVRERRVDKNSCVANLGEGHSFGELGLIRNDVRSAALLTHSDCLFLTLDKKSFQHCLGNFLKQKSDDKVQALRQVLPGAKELRKLVVEQLTYFFKEATVQKDVALSTEGNKEETLYLILVKGNLRPQRYVGDFHSICAGEGEGELAAKPISRVVARARRQQKEQKAATECPGSPTAVRSSDASSFADSLSKENGSEGLRGMEDPMKTSRAKKPSVFLEELDLALLQEGCIVNFCSLFFDSPEPFSVFAFSSKTQVFSISRTELFNHMPLSVLEAVRLTGLLLLQHLERRIGQQEECIRRFELIHQRDATQGTAKFKSTDKNATSGGVSGPSHVLLPLTFSPFLSKTMGEYIDASSLALEGHFDRFTRNLLCFQPHAAVLKNSTFRLLQQQKQRRQQQHQSAPSALVSISQATPSNHESKQKTVSPTHEGVQREQGVFKRHDHTFFKCESAGSGHTSLTPESVLRWGSGRASGRAGRPAPMLGPNRRLNEAACTGTRLSRETHSPPFPQVSPVPSMMPNLSSQPSSSETRKVVSASSKLLETEYGATTETIEAREAAACASCALAIGHPIVSDSALEFFFQNISRDAVNINNKICCRYQSEAQLLQATPQSARQAGNNRLDLRQTAHSSSCHQSAYTLTKKGNGMNDLPFSRERVKLAKHDSQLVTVRDWPRVSAAQTKRRSLAALQGTGKIQKLRVPHLVIQSLPQSNSRPKKGSSTAHEVPENYILLQQHREQHLLSSGGLPHLHLLLQRQDVSRKKDRAVSLRGMAAAMQARRECYLKAGDACEAPRGASACTGRRMLAQQVALRLHAQRNEGA
ncbi:hypothetical protein Esti_001512 [Eimeria stiedai]